MQGPLHDKLCIPINQPRRSLEDGNNIYGPLPDERFRTLTDQPSYNFQEGNSLQLVKQLPRSVEQYGVG
jgi:hypothetical protein